jgi:hypothetical protein
MSDDDSVVNGKGVIACPKMALLTLSACLI